MPDNISGSISTTGRVTVGNSLTGEIETTNDSDAYAVELVAGRTYRIDLEGAATDKGTLADPFLRWLRDSSGDGLHGTRDYDGGEGLNPRQVFTPQWSGTYYITASGQGDSVGTYTLRVTEILQTVSELAGEDFSTNISTAGRIVVDDTATGNIGTRGDRDWFAVELVADREYQIDLRGSPTGDGTLSDPYLRGIHDAEGTLISGTTNDDVGRADYNSRVTFTASETGTYYIAAGAFSGRLGTYELEVTDTSTVTELQQSGPQAGQAPVFSQPSYAFELAENADGALFGIAVAPVVATDPDNDRITYSIEAGDPDGLFMIDAGTGLVVYVGAGEDYESGTTSYELTVRASDGGLHTDVTVTVNVTDVEEYAILEQTANVAPQFTYANYAFGLPENADGATVPVSLGSVQATDPDNDPVAYSIESGDPDGLFMIDAGTGLVVYVGAGEDYESGTTSYELTVRASDGGLHTDVTVTVNVADVVEPGIRVSDAEADEGDGVLRFRVTLSEPSTAPVTVNYATADATALAGQDYESGSGELEFAPGETEKVVEVTIIDDLVEDSGETVTLRLSAAVGGYLENAEGVGTILNSETVSEGDADLPEDTTTTGRVVVGESATGEIASDGDHDWFAVELEADRTYRIDLEGWWTGAGTLDDSYLRGIHDADGNLISGTTNIYGGMGYNSRVFFTATEAGTYYVAAGAYGNEEGTYTLSVTDVTDIADDIGTVTSGAVVVGGSSTGEIEAPNDRDWFAVTLNAGKTYRVDLEGSATGAGSLWDPYLYGIYDAGGNYIPGTYDDDGGAVLNSRVRFTATEDATYYVAAGAYGNEEGTYTLSVTDVADGVPDDFAAGTGTSGEVVVGNSAHGDIETRDDRDWFAVTLEADKTYRFDLEGSLTDAGTLRNPYLRGIHDADGNLLPGTSNSSGDAAYHNSRVDFMATEDAIYYVAAGAYGDAEGTYTLSVTDVTNGVPDDFAAGTGTSGEVEVGNSAHGEIETRDDRDWFAVTLEAGTTYRIDLEGSSTDAGTLRIPYLHGIHDADGNLLPDTSNRIGGEYFNSRVNFTATEDATYYVAAGAYGTAEGTYTLSVEEVM